MKQAGVDAFLITRPENRFYFSGFTGSEGILLVTPVNSYIFVDFRYIEQAKSQCSQWTVVQMSRSAATEGVLVYLKQDQVNVLGFEGDFLSYQEYCDWKEAWGIPLLSLPTMLSDIRKIKEPIEVEYIARAVQLADDAFAHILSMIRPGVMEREIGLELEFFMRQQGASGGSFPFIVASGPRSAMPHGVASERKIQQGDLLLMDYGAIFEGYCSDMTRTVMVGYAEEKHRTIYQIVLEAQLAALATVKAGIPASMVDQAAREVIKSYGYGEYFGHGTGHGVGLVIHEEPRVSKNDDTILTEGMVITVEPGIYLPGWGGIRIEDMVLVKSQGCNIFTKSPKQELLVCA